jgi:diadenylate cyclase
MKPTNPPLESMKKLGPQLKLWFTRDWEAKLVSLVLAFLLWYVVKDQVARDGRQFRPEQLPSMRL